MHITEFIAQVKRPAPPKFKFADIAFDVNNGTYLPDELRLDFLYGGTKIN